MTYINFLIFYSSLGNYSKVETLFSLVNSSFLGLGTVHSNEIVSGTTSSKLAVDCFSSSRNFSESSSSEEIYYSN